jgi:hypothetical protein
VSPPTRATTDGTTISSCAPDLAQEETNAPGKIRTCDTTFRKLEALRQITYVAAFAGTPGFPP